MSVVDIIRKYNIIQESEVVDGVEVFKDTIGVKDGTSLKEDGMLETVTAMKPEILAYFEKRRKALNNIDGLQELRNAYALVDKIKAMYPKAAEYLEVEKLRKYNPTYGEDFLSSLVEELEEGDNI